jgi:DNA-binding NtrC family response regulator
MEDDPDALALYHFMFKKQGYKIFQARSISQARTLLQRHVFDLFLSDILMPDGRATHLIRDTLPRLAYDTMAPASC